LAFGPEGFLPIGDLPSLTGKHSFTIREDSMNFTYTFKNMDHSDQMVEYSQTKLEKLAKYDLPIGLVHMVCGLESHGARVTMNVTGRFISMQVAIDDTDMYSAIDRAIEKISRQLSKRKGKNRRRQQQHHAHYEAWEQAEIAMQEKKAA
jgi:putative sigma-54 modulation protein